MHQLIRFAAVICCPLLLSASCVTASMKSTNPVTNLLSAKLVPHWYRHAASKKPVTLAKDSHNQQILETSISANDPRLSAMALASYAIREESGQSFTLQPGVASWNLANNEVSGGVQIANDDVATGADANHDFPQIAQLGYGGTLVAYGAISPYTAWNSNPKRNPTWDCSLGSSVIWKCQPFKFGRGPSQLAASTEFFFPSTGLSEISAALYGNTTLMAGSVQWGTQLPAGSFAYLAYHATGDADGYFDTARGTQYDPFKEQINQAKSGVELLARPPHDNAWFEFTINSGASERSTLTIEIGKEKCTLNLSGSQDAQEVASLFVAFFNDPTRCGFSAKGFRAVVPHYDPYGDPNRTVGIESNAVNVYELGQAKDPDCGDLQCSSSRTLTSYGGHVHFVRGAVIHRNRYFYALLASENETISWFGPAANGSDGSFVCLRSSGSSPDGSWRWTDCAGKHPFDVSPAETGADVVRLGLLFNAGSSYVIPPPHAYAPGMVPFVFDMGQEAWPAYSKMPSPIAGGISFVPDDKGNIWIAYGCQDTARSNRLCFLKYNPVQRSVQSIGFLDPHSSHSRAAIGIATAESGNMVVGAAVGNGREYGCEHEGPCLLEILFNQKRSKWSSSVLYSFDGSPTIGSPGSVSRTEDDEHLLFNVLYGSFESGSTHVAAFDLKT